MCCSRTLQVGGHGSCWARLLTASRSSPSIKDTTHKDIWTPAWRSCSLLASVHVDPKSLKCSETCRKIRKKLRPLGPPLGGRVQVGSTPGADGGTQQDIQTWAEPRKQAATGAGQLTGHRCRRRRASPADASLQRFHPAVLTTVLQVFPGVAGLVLSSLTPPFWKRLPAVTSEERRSLRKPANHSVLREGGYLKPAHKLGGALENKGKKNMSEKTAIKCGGEGLNWC